VYLTRLKEGAMMCDEPGIFKVSRLVVMLPGGDKPEIEHPLQQRKHKEQSGGIKKRQTLFEKSCRMCSSHARLALGFQ